MAGSKFNFDDLKFFYGNYYQDYKYPQQGQPFRIPIVLDPQPQPQQNNIVITPPMQQFGGGEGQLEYERDHWKKEAERVATESWRRSLQYNQLVDDNEKLRKQIAALEEELDALLPERLK